MQPGLKKLDHLVYSTPDFERSVSELEQSLGVRAAPGGQHPGRGTRNALISMSDSSYLEIIGPDPTQFNVKVPRWFGIDTIAGPRLFTWAAKEGLLQKLVDEAARRGVHLGPVVSGSRRGSNGVNLEWKFTDPATVVGDGIVPFFIDWGDSPHPAISSPGGVTLVALSGRHPEPGMIERQLSAVGIQLGIERGPEPALIATLRTPRGDVEIS